MNSSDLKNQAEAFEIGLETGSVSVAEVVAWADLIIEAEPTPSYWICEIAMMGDKHPLDVVAVLREMPGQATEDIVVGLVAQYLLKKLEADCAHADRIAAVLYYLADYGKIKDPQLCEIALWAADALSLADAGIIDQTRDQVIAELIDLLHRIADGSKPLQK